MGRGQQPDGTAPLPGPEATAGRYRISQVELKALHDLNQRLNKIKAEYAERRREFLDRLERGEEAEPGLYKAVREVSTHSRLTIAILKDYFGEEYVEDLRQHLPRVKEVTLRVTGPKKQDRIEPRAQMAAQPVTAEADPGAW